MRCRVVYGTANKSTICSYSRRKVSEELLDPYFPDDFTSLVEPTRV